MRTLGFIVASLALGVPATIFAQQATPTVSVITAEKRPITESVRFVGRIQAIDRVDVRARVIGFLEEVLFQDGQQVKISGTLNGRQVDSTINFSEGNGFYYYLNNGANFLLFNIVKRWNWQQNKNGKFKLDALAKAGIGPVIPHVQNSLFGKANDPGFQLGGWNIGVEGGVRATFYKYVYLEFSNKIDYARYSNLGVYQGKAKQAFGTYELILSLGFTIPTGRVINN